MNNGNISVECLAYTNCPEHNFYPLLTVIIDIPTYLLAQINTHKSISKNTQSTRAVPTNTLLGSVPSYIPTIVGFNNKGMAPVDFLDSGELAFFQEWWKNLRYTIEEEINTIQQYFKNKTGKTIEKGIINRVISNFTYSKQILTAEVSPKGWLNFLKLRLSENAQSEIKIVAERIKEIINTHKINESSVHMPYNNIKESVVNCATISYRKEQHNFEDIDRIYNNLVTANPPHSSTMEHQGYCYNCYKDTLKERNLLLPMHHVDLHANFSSTCFVQLRKLIELGIKF